MAEKLLSGSGRKIEIICCENLPAMRIFMRDMDGVDFNHEAITGTRKKDEQEASIFPREIASGRALNQGSLQVLGNVVCLFLTGVVSMVPNERVRSIPKEILIN